MTTLLAQNSPRFRFTLDSDILGPLVLKNDPIGWDELGKTLTRSSATHGLLLDYSVQMGFIKEAKAYLELAYATLGIEADVRVLIEQENPNTWLYDEYYRGRIDFSDAEFTSTEVRCNVENEDFSQRFLNRDDVPIDLWGNTTVSGAASRQETPLTVELHSRAVVKRHDVSNPANLPPVISEGLFFDDDSRSQTRYFGFAKVTTDELGLAAGSPVLTSGDATTAVPIYQAKGQEELTIEFALTDTIQTLMGPGGRTIDIKYHFRINGDPSTATVLATDSFTTAIDGNRYSHQFAIPPTTIQATLNENDAVYLYAELYYHNPDTGIVTFNTTVYATLEQGSYLRITAVTQTAPTPCNGLLVYEALDRLSTALADTPDAFRSTYFGRTDTRIPYDEDGPGALALVAGGFQLRGFPTPFDASPTAPAPDSRKSLFASWRELYDSLAAIHGLGYGIERLQPTGKSVVRVEPMAYFYPAQVVLDLTGLGPLDATAKVNAERHYNTVEVGYETWEPEGVNGLDEFNTKRQWTTPLTRIKNALTAVSRYITSGLRLELVRRQRYSETSTTDGATDNNNFLIALLRKDGGGFETERNQRFARLDGMLSPETVYNAIWSPARNLRNHGAALRAGLAPLGGSAVVRFAFGEGNNNVVSRLQTETADIAESADVLTDELAAPLWLPLDYTFTCPLTAPQAAQLFAQPYGRVRFLDAKSRPCEGWVLTVKHNAAKKEGDFTLLACAVLSA